MFSGLILYNNTIYAFIKVKRDFLLKDFRYRPLQKEEIRYILQ